MPKEREENSRITIRLTGGRLYPALSVEKRLSASVLEEEAALSVPDVKKKIIINPATDYGNNPLNLYTSEILSRAMRYAAQRRETGLWTDFSQTSLKTLTIFRSSSLLT